MAGGTVAKADTAVLSLQFLRSGLFSHIVGMPGAATSDGYIWESSAMALTNTNDLRFSDSSFNSASGHNKGTGFGFRCKIPSTHLLSGSYGLAGGRLAVLALEFRLSGNYLPSEGRSRLQGNYGYYRTKTMTSWAVSGLLYIAEGRFNPAEAFGTNEGFSVR